MHDYYQAKIVECERNCPGPWNEKLDEPKAAQTLMKNIHPKGTLDGLLFDHPIEVYKHTLEERSRELKVHKNFRFGSINCRGTKTPVHMIFRTELKEYSDLLRQEPDYLYTLDGDGTVLIVN